MALDLATVSFLFPVALINKFVFTRLTGRNFNVTLNDKVDCLIAILVVIWWDNFNKNAASENLAPLLGEPYDSEHDIKVMRNIIY